MTSDSPHEQPLNSKEEPQHSENHEVDTSGGSYIEGSVHTSGGDFIAGNKIVYETIASLRPGMAPPVPSLIVGREKDLAALRDRLNAISNAPSLASVQVLTAIKGWPGVGKTTIASSIAHDPQVISAFPDGVLWVSLGPKPDLLTELATWGRALGLDDLIRARNIEEAQTKIIALLREKRMLLIVDDVWAVEHAQTFRVGGRLCAMLVTTRQEDIAQAVAPTDSSVYRLGVLSDSDSLELLRQLAPKIVEKYEDDLKVLVHELEGLPLALQVAGRLLNAEAHFGFGVKPLIEELREGAKLLRATPPADRLELLQETTPTVTTLLKTSTDLLDDFTRDCYAYLGVFAPKPATFDLDAMKSVWMVEDPSPVVKILVNRGLLEFVEELGRYQMHALLVMHAKSLLS